MTLPTCTSFFAACPPPDVPARTRTFTSPLLERIEQPLPYLVRANPKSSTGRLDLFTRLLADQLLAATDRQERRTHFQRMLDILEEEAPVSILYSINEIIGKKTRVNYTQYPLYYMDLRPDVFSFT